MRNPLIALILLGAAAPAWAASPTAILCRRKPGKNTWIVRPEPTGEAADRYLRPLGTPLISLTLFVSPVS